MNVNIKYQLRYKDFYTILKVQKRENLVKIVNTAFAIVKLH